MSKQLRLLASIIGIIGFIILGIYIVKTSDKLIGQIIGWSNIIFFTGFLLWASFKYITRKKTINLK